MLGAILLDASVLDMCFIARLDAADFYWEPARLVYQAVDECALEGLTPTPITVSAMLGRLGTIDEAGGEPYVADLASRVFTPIGADAYIKTILNTSRLRKAIFCASQTVSEAFAGGDSATVIGHALEQFGKLLNERDAGLEKLGLASLEQPEGLTWDIPILDSITMGCVPGQMSIVAGGTGEGKSMFAGQIARTIAAGGGRVVIYSMEMENREYESRMVHAVSGVRKRVSRSDAPYTDIERGMLAEAQMKVAEWDIYSTSRSGVSAQLIASSVRAMNSEKQVDLVVVDYLQLMERHGDNDAEALK